MSEMNQEEQELPNYILVPRERLSAEALDGLVNEFILREGTDYGHADVTLEQKRAKVFKQIESSQVLIAYSPNEDSCTLLLERELSALGAKGQQL